MKKICAILLIMFMVIGCVFANETHTIKVKADVTEIVPVFGMKLTTPANDYVTNTATLKENSTTEYTTQYGKKETYGMTDNATAIDVNFNLDEEGSVVVICQLLNKAKQNETYDLTFTGGVFTVSRQGTPNLTYGPDKITTAAGTNTTGVSMALGAAVGTSTTNKVVGLIFDGKTVTANVPYTLATATYHYPGDQTIDPNTNGDFYYADITLTISAT